LPPCARRRGASRAEGRRARWTPFVTKQTSAPLALKEGSSAKYRLNIIVSKMTKRAPCV
jgi:hypothetical protein